MKSITAILTDGPADGERFMSTHFMPTIYIPDPEHIHVIHVYNFTGVYGEQVNYLWEGTLE